MNKKVLRTAIVTAWAMLLFSFIFKLCGSKAFEIVAVNERFVVICDWLDNDDRRYPLYEDYGEDDCYLDEDELMQWAKRLMREVPDNDKGMFSKEMIEHKAKEMGIEFGKDFTFAKFYATAIMLYTDFRKVLGGGNIDLYVRLAQAWLMDDDIDIDAGEKLCAYYESIVNA